VGGFLFPLYNRRTAAAVFGAVGFGLKCPTADRAPFCGSVPKNLRFERLSGPVLQQYPPEELAVDGVGNVLYTDNAQ